MCTKYFMEQAKLKSFFFFNQKFHFAGHNTDFHLLNVVNSQI